MIEVGPNLAPVLAIMSVCFAVAAVAWARAFGRRR